MGTLIVYYSRNGGTRKAVEALAAELGADLAEIREAKRRKGLFGFLRSGMESARRKIVPILPLQPERDLGAYDRVIVAGPVWAGNVASPVRSFLVAHMGELREFGALITHAAPDDPYSAVLAEMESLAGKPRAFERSVAAPFHLG